MSRRAALGPVDGLQTFEQGSMPMPCAPTLPRRTVPPIVEVRDLLSLGPCVLPTGEPPITDHLDSESGRFAYRFFRDADEAPIALRSEGFELAKAWLLSDAAFLAYVDTRTVPCTEEEARVAASVVEDRIRPSLSRLFASLRRDEPARVGCDISVRAIVRGCALAGIHDPVQCYVADDGQFGIVAFRGTLPTSLANWLVDMDVELTDAAGWAEGVRVHAGFWRAASALLEDYGQIAGLRRYLTERYEASPELELHFTGHSLGGALAILAAWDVRRAQSVHTYGSPRVGNERFVETFSQNGIAHYRVVHRHDLVPHLPASTPFLQYVHGGQLKHIEPAPPDGSAPDGPRARSCESQDFTVVAPANPVVATATATATPTAAVGLPPTLSETEVSDTLGHFEESVGRVWSRLREHAEHLRLKGIEGWLEGITDHAPIFYSIVLWNELVNDVWPASRGSGAGGEGAGDSLG